MELLELQNQIKKFNDDREWSHPRQIKDLLLNMSEEVGEFWNKIKWVDVETQVKIIKENKEEVSNDLADMLYLILKLAYICDVNLEKSLKEVMDEYEQRFPLEQTKGHHGNILASGIDNKK
ncbi:hypothetical protein KO361_01480 [Candidatus Woesearchaeota archaeon]|nr:hypothetical protein [Candidatus Woesearchaeota archaeon]